ncbi:MAG: hypothetical protein NXI27_10265 [Alphaproteobacteria bacterium]|nr:hypothetical protein [Alphaproteobacteria bacterium]
MIPVLSVKDTDAARMMLAGQFGFREAGSNSMTLGDQTILIAAAGETPDTLVRLPLDHIALSVACAETAFKVFHARGACLAAAYTPDGVGEIGEFWDRGVRFVFFEGPEGAPIEFCETIGETRQTGHSHYGLRAADLDGLETQFATLGAEPVARHTLGGDPPVDVRFLQAGSAMLELFDDTQCTNSVKDRGWVGFVF